MSFRKHNHFGQTTNAKNETTNAKNETTNAKNCLLNIHLDPQIPHHQSKVKIKII